jgi:serine/threonine protein kinase
MSPERTRGRTDIDARSDIYSLGATLYALLTGRPPFEGENLRDIIKKIREGNPVSPRKYQLAVPDVLEGITLKMLARRPEDRYETAGEVRAALERIADFHNL